MNKHRITLVAALASAAVALTAHATAAPAAQPRAAAAAQAVVTDFFEAVEARRYAEACSYFGQDLLYESGGPRCAAFLRSGVTAPLRWKIVGRQPVPDGMGVVVRLAQNELDHVRMRTWLAVVRLEHGSPKIVQTRLLR